MVVDASAMLVLSDPSSHDRLARLVAAIETAAVTPIAPHLMWSEATSILHLLLNHGRIDAPAAESRRALLESAPVRAENPPGLLRRAWEIADRMGWGRTYDAEYCALADMAGGRLVTGDARLVRAAQGRLPFVDSLDGAVARLPKA